MSDEFDENDESEGFKNLRKQYEQQKKDMKAMQDQLSTYLQKERASTVAETLKAKGVEPKFAKFYTGEDASAEAVEKWIAEQVSDGIFPSSKAQEEDANASQAQRMQAALSSNEIDGEPQNARFMGNPTEAAKLMATLPREKLQEMGWLPQDNLRVI